MARTPEQVQAAAAANVERHHSDMAGFHDREAVKYADKAAKLRAAGKERAAARADKVAARNRAKVAEHQAKLAD